jgi:hypothetical protein
VQVIPSRYAYLAVVQLVMEEISGHLDHSVLSHLSERICRSVALRFSLPSDDRPAILRFGFWQLPTAEKQFFN